jgi:pyridoxine 5-phosphate synthase
VRASKALGVQQIELHTGEYAHAFDDTARRATELKRLGASAHLGHGLGLEIAAGHGLTLANVPELVRNHEIVELNIGHAMIADAVFMSLAGAVRAMRESIARGQ